MKDGSVFSLSHGEDEMDVELQTALQEFQQELRRTQRDRVYLNPSILSLINFFFSRIFGTFKPNKYVFLQDEATAQIVSLNQQLTELQSSQDRSATQLQQLQKSLKQSEQGKKTSRSYKRNKCLYFKSVEAYSI